MNWAATGAAFLALAVILGAFGAHALRTRFDAYSMDVWEKAVFYHFIHALGLLIVGGLARCGLPATECSESSLLVACRRNSDLLRKPVHPRGDRSENAWSNHTDRRCRLHRRMVDAHA